MTETLAQGRAQVLCVCGCGLTVRPGRKYIHGHNAGTKTFSVAEYVVQDCGYKSPCWVWQRATNDQGYPQTSIDGKVVYAHRVFYQKSKGVIPPSLHLDHLCAPFGGPRTCVNPEHLEPVTTGENTRRGRAAKIDNVTADRIRDLYALGNLTQCEIGRMFGLDGSRVSRIVNGKAWCEARV